VNERDEKKKGRHICAFLSAWIFSTDGIRKKKKKPGFLAYTIQKYT